MKAFPDSAVKKTPASARKAKRRLAASFSTSQVVDEAEAPTARKAVDGQEEKDDENILEETTPRKRKARGSASASNEGGDVNGDDSTRTAQQEPRNEGDRPGFIAKSSPLYPTFQYLNQLWDCMQWCRLSDLSDELLSCAAECAGKEIDLLCHSATAVRLTEIARCCPKMKLRLLEAVLQQEPDRVLQLLQCRSAAPAVAFAAREFAACAEPMDERTKMLLLRLCRLMHEHFDRLVADVHGAHAVGQFARVLCRATRTRPRGVILTTRQLARHLRSDTKLTDPERAAAFEALASKALNWAAIKAAGTEHMSKTRLYADFIALDHGQGGQHVGRLVKSMLAEDKQTLFLFMCDQKGSQIFQELLLCCSPKDMKKVYDHCVKGSIGTLATDTFGNYCAQVLLERGAGLLNVSQVANEVFDVLEKVWFENRFGVVASLSKLIASDKQMQRKFVKLLVHLLNCDAEKEDRRYFLHCLLNMSPLSDKIKRRPTESIQSYGVDIAQTMINYDVRKTILKSLLLMKNDALAAVAESVFGSYLLQTVFRSASLSADIKSKILHKLNGFFADLALQPGGRFVVEAVLETAGDEDRLAVITQLLRRETHLLSSRSGKLLWLKFRLSRFKLSSSPDQWATYMQRLEHDKKQLIDSCVSFT